MIRITLDTNQLVRALMRPPELATLIMAWESRRFSVVASAALLTEYERVLIYPDIANLIFPELLRAFRSHLVQDIQIIELATIEPICRDPDDDKVIATAIAGKVNYLITEDSDLLTPDIIAILSGAGVSVISTGDLLKLLG